MALKDDVERLLEVMRKLRDPDGGCPWDRRQDFASIAAHTLEEAYEVTDAIERGDLDELRDELGDLLFQVVFHARLAEEREAFDFSAVVTGLVDKLIRRHPHVFADRQIEDEAELHRMWEAGKADERQDRSRLPSSEMDGVPLALPALSRAQKLQRRAARVGFDWDRTEAVFAKLDEEVAELRQAIASRDPAAVRAELGDTLFTVVNLARHLDQDAERSLREASTRFERRFRACEASAGADDTELAACDPTQLDAYWNRSKQTTNER